MASNRLLKTECEVELICSVPHKGVRVADNRFDFDLDSVLGCVGNHYVVNSVRVPQSKHFETMIYSIGDNVKESKKCGSEELGSLMQIKKHTRIEFTDGANLNWSVKGLFINGLH